VVTVKTTNAEKSRPLVVATNDDGVDAIGLRTLAESLREQFDVLVVAPDRERSAVGHAVTLSAQWRIGQPHLDVFAVDGTPADCVYLAVCQLAPRPPAAVVSGVNDGFNLGTDVIYSGTVAAAAEAAVLQVPGIAVSADRGASSADLERAARFATRLADWVIRSDWRPPGALLNVNVPRNGGGTFRVGAMGIRQYARPQRCPVGPRIGEVFRLERPRADGFDGARGEDVEIMRRGHIAVTPLRLDWTAREQIAPLRELERGGFESDCDAGAEAGSATGAVSGSTPRSAPGSESVPETKPGPTADLETRETKAEAGRVANAEPVSKPGLERERG
jgi:5'-nucleotidase